MSCGFKERFYLVSEANVIVSNTKQKKFEKDELIATNSGKHHTFFQYFLHYFYFLSFF